MPFPVTLFNRKEDFIMRTSRYEIFLKAAELGNLSRTAEYFSYTPSAISQTVKALEEDLAKRAGEPG